MKKLVSICFITIFSVNFFSQDKEIKDILKNIDIPNSPALTVLGVATTEIERPKTTKELVFGVINSFKENKGIPNNYAFEVTPFWMVKRRDMTSLKYAGIKDNGKQNIFNNIQKSSISVGFVSQDIEPSKPKTLFFSAGIRSNLIAIRSRKNRDSIVAIDSKLQANLSKAMDLWNAYAEQNNYNAMTDFNLYTKEKEEFMKKLENPKIDYKKTLDTPPVFAVDFAAAYSTFFQDNSFSNNHFGKFGAWFTLSSGIDLAPNNKEIEKNYLNFYIITRYLLDGTQANDVNNYTRIKNFDFGGKAEFTYEKFSISYEYIYRTNDSENTRRSNGTISYRISDGLFLTGAFGRNFGKQDNLISLLGINWGLSSKRESIFIN